MRYASFRCRLSVYAIVHVQVDSLQVPIQWQPGYTPLVPVPRFTPGPAVQTSMGVYKEGKFICTAFGCEPPRVVAMHGGRYIRYGWIAYLVPRPRYTGKLLRVWERDTV